ncbi:flavin monoamine oxidase family protein [Candidatus Thiosymbion oneisti]|uniref:flavin monoamine oxidase family protein n=1 Tax=Candidatus Thiosymbion oneisti TaxID=589554 RepID=UPI000AFA188A|nr:NAD(P)/FAD-dependent oxidoreductase [Candidatus Thiosymbion oneisti]
MTKANHITQQPTLIQTRDWTRRRFLQTAVAGTAVAGAGLPVLAGASAPKIVVVGAGLAGLNAAWQLKKAGLHADVYEATGRTGGRVFTLENAVGPGLTSDLGGSFIDSIHTEMLTLVQELKVELLDYEDDEETLADTVNFFGGTKYTDEQKMEALQPFLPRIGEDYRKARSNPQEAGRLDRLPTSEYMTWIGMEGWIRDCMEVLFKMEMGLECEEQSALVFISQLAPDSEGNTMMFDLHDERYLVKGGSQRLPDALAAQLDGQIHVHHALEAVRPAGSGFVLNFSSSNGAPKEVKADIAVLTVPFSVLRHTDLRVELPPLKKQAIAELGYGTNAKIIAGFRARLWRKQGYYGDVLTDLPFQSLWDSTPFQPGPAGALTFLFGGRAGFELIEGFNPNMAMLNDLEPVFPGLSKAYNGRHTLWNWPTWTFSRGSYSCYKPGQQTTLAHAAGRPVGNLYFAGEHCSTEFNGFMNGAAETGHRVADAIVASL